MPKSTRKDPYGAFNFLVEIEDVVVAGFTEVTGLETETEIIEYREGNEDIQVRKLPGLNKNPVIVLRKGVTDNRQLWNWRKAVIDGDHKLILDRGRGIVRVFDMRRDPRERINLLAKAPKLYRQLMSLLDAYVFRAEEEYPLP